VASAAAAEEEEEVEEKAVLAEEGRLMHHLCVVVEGTETHVEFPRKKISRARGGTPSL